MLRALGNAIGDRPCRAHTSELRIYVEAVGSRPFPTARSSADRSRSTGGKLEAYRTIPSLRDHVVVSHRERRVTVHHRDDAGGWSTTTAVAGGSVMVASLGAVLAVDAIYRHSGVA